MDAQHTADAYWMPIDPYTQASAQPPMYDLTSELAAVQNNTILDSSQQDTAHYDTYAVAFPHHAYTHLTDDLSFTYANAPTVAGATVLPMTPSDSSCFDDSPYCSPQPSYAHIYASPPLPSTAPTASHYARSVSPHSSISGATHSHSSSSSSSSSTSTSSALAAAAAAVADRSHATSGRRRAQNRAAQRAFRERKEKHARDLEEALQAMTDKWKGAESRVRELEMRYEKLRRTVEVLVGSKASGTEERGEKGAAAVAEGETVRRVVQVMCGEDEGEFGRRSA